MDDISFKFSMDSLIKGVVRAAGFKSHAYPQRPPLHLLDTLFPTTHGISKTQHIAPSLLHSHHQSTELGSALRQTDARLLEIYMRLSGKVHLALRPTEADQVEGLEMVEFQQLADTDCSRDLLRMGAALLAPPPTLLSLSPREPV